MMEFKKGGVRWLETLIGVGHFCFSDIFLFFLILDLLSSLLKA